MRRSARWAVATDVSPAGALPFRRVARTIARSEWEGDSMGKLEGKAAIVTGAGRGLGRAYARRLAGRGAKVAVAALTHKPYEEFEAEAKAMTADSTVAEIE